MINIIASVSENNVIGNNCEIPWSIPEDLHYFAQTTNGTVLIMGRITFESIGYTLPNRFSIVVSKTKIYSGKQVLTTNSLVSALKYAKELINSDKYKEIFICGGQKLYEEGQKYADRQYITRVHANFKGDRFFPKINVNVFKLIKQNDICCANKIKITYEIYKKFFGQTYSTLNK